MLGETRMVSLPNRALWLISGNNPRFSREIARRCVRTRIDAKQIALILDSEDFELIATNAEGGRVDEAGHCEVDRRDSPDVRALCARAEKGAVVGATADFILDDERVAEVPATPFSAPVFMRVSSHLIGAAARARDRLDRGLRGGAELVTIPGRSCSQRALIAKPDS